MEAGHSHAQSPGFLHRQDSWTCPRCGWVYPNPHPSAKHRRNHKKHCGKIKGFEFCSTPRDGGSSDDASSDEESHSKKKAAPETPGKFVMPQEESHILPSMDTGSSTAEHSEIKTSLPDKQDPTLVCQPSISIPQSDSIRQSISVLPSIDASPTGLENSERKILAQQDNAESALNAAEICTADTRVSTGEDLKEKGILASSAEDTGSNAGDFQPGTSSESEILKCIEPSRNGAAEVEDGMEGRTSIKKNGGDLDSSAGRLEKGEVNDTPPVLSVEKQHGDTKILAARGVVNDTPPVLSVVKEHGDTKILAEQDNAESALKSEDITTPNTVVKLKGEDGVISSDKDTGVSQGIESLRDEALPAEDNNETHPVLERNCGDTGISIKGLDRGKENLSSLCVAEHDIRPYEMSRDISSSQTHISENVDDENFAMKEDPSSNSISADLEGKDLRQDGEAGGGLLIAKAVELPAGASSEQALNLSETVASGPECLSDREIEIRPNERNSEIAIPGQPDTLISHSDRKAVSENTSIFEGCSAAIEGTQMHCQVPAEVKDIDKALEGDVPPDSKTEMINLKLEKPDSEALERSSEKSGDACQEVVSVEELPKKEKTSNEDSHLESSTTSLLSYIPCNAEAGKSKEEVLQKTVFSDFDGAGLQKSNVTETGSLSSQAMDIVIGHSFEEAFESGKTVVSGPNSLHCVETKSSLNNNYLASRGATEGRSLDPESKAGSEDDSVHVVSPIVIEGESHPCQLSSHIDNKEKSIEGSVLPDLRAETMEPRNKNPDAEQTEKICDKLSESALQEKVVSVAQLMNKSATADVKFQENSTTKAVSGTTAGDKFQEDSTTKAASSSDLGDVVKESDNIMHLQTQESCEVANEIHPGMIASSREPEIVLDNGCMPLGGVKAVFSERSDSLETETYEDAPDSFETGSVGGSIDENEVPDYSHQITDGRLEGQKPNLPQAAASTVEKVPENSIEMNEKPNVSNNSSSSEVVPEKKEDLMSKENIVGTSTTQDLKAPSPEAWQELGTSEVGSEDNEARAEQSVQPVPKSSHTEVREHQISEKEHTPLRSLLAKEGSEKLDQNHLTNEKDEEKKKLEENWGSHNDQKPKARSIWSHCICCPAVH